MARKKMLKKCIQYITKENLLLLKDLLTSISKNVYIDKLDDIVNNKYTKTYHRTIKINPVDVKPSMYIDFNKENNKEVP